MIDLHCAPTGNNLKIAIALEELGLEYRLVKYDMYAGTHLTPAFRAINPNSKTPAMVDHAPRDGGSALRIFESGAILQYLAEKSGHLIPLDWRARQEAQQWLVWQVAGLGPMLGQAHHFVRYAPEGQQYGIDRYLREARRLYEVLNRQLCNQEFLAGEYSIADIACYPGTTGTRLLGIDNADYPALAEWADRIRSRPAVQRATAALMDGDVSKYTQQRMVLTPDEWSNLFGERALLNAQADY